MTAGPCYTPRCESTDTRRYLTGPHCDPHSPWGIAGRPDPRTQIDPTRREDVLRVAPTPEFAKGGTDINKERPGGYVSRQRAVKLAAERDATSTIQHPERTTRAQ